ncbi:MAG TPA: cyclic nucleotide-binding domain-containing protein [Anaeromyxobacteraceae bacterium]
MTVVEALQGVPLLKDFSASGLETLADIARARALPAGTVLFKEDQAGDSFFLVCRGSLRLLQRDGGAGRELAMLGPGDHLGDLGLLARTVRLVTAVAATDCELLELTRRAFFKKAQEKPLTCLKLAAVVAGEIARRAEASRDALRELGARQG